MFHLFKRTQRVQRSYIESKIGMSGSGLAKLDLSGRST